MIGLNRLSWVLRGSAILVFGGMLAGCGGISPGDYVLYSVAEAGDTKSSGCFPGGFDPQTHSDTDDGVKDITWAITAGPNDEFYLEGENLQGEKSDSGYDFHETKVDVQYNDPVTKATKITTTTLTDVPITVDGETISGTKTVKVSVKCSGQCPPDGVPTCTTSTEFNGAKIDDVKLEHDPAK